jgi:hypothetical protein
MFRPVLATFLGRSSLFLTVSMFFAARPGFSRTAGEQVLPGKIPAEIVLSARADDTSSRAVVFAVMADLRRTPLRHTVKIVLRGDSMKPGPNSERVVLARLDLEEIDGTPGVQPVLEISPRTPGWLVYALLRSGEAAGSPLAVTDRRFPLLGQLVARSGTVLRDAGRETLQERETPSVALSGRSLLTAGTADPDARPAVRSDLWAQVVAAAVRRLDALAGRPLEEDQYLAVGGRVWLRRDLIWVGFLVWGLLVFRGLPGRWRGASAAEHGRQMRAYLPGFLFRALLLAAIFLAPVFAVLLLPAAVLALLPPRFLRPVWARVLCIAFGLLPLGAYLAALAFAVAHRIVSLEDGFAGGRAAAVLIPATLLAYGALILQGGSGTNRASLGRR